MINKFSNRRTYKWKQYSQHERDPPSETAGNVTTYGGPEGSNTNKKAKHKPKKKKMEVNMKMELIQGVSRKGLQMKNIL